MSIPQNKNELLNSVSMRFDKLLKTFEEVPAHLAKEKSMEGHAKGSMMSPSDLVSYLIGWHELVLKWLEQDDDGKAVCFPEQGFKWNELGRLAQKFYRDYEMLSYPEALAKLRVVHRRLVDDISGRADEELYGTPWYDKWTKGRMIQLNSASPYENARGRIRRWLKSLQV